MNKHGQTLILFVILIPIILILMAIIVDIGLVLSKKAHITEVAKMIIKDSMNKDEEVIKKLFIENNISTDKLEIIKKKDYLEINIELEVESIFGSIIGIDKYPIKVHIIGEKKNGKIYY